MLHTTAGNLLVLPLSNKTYSFFIHYLYTTLSFILHDFYPFLIKVQLLQKPTWLFVTGNTNIRWIKISHLYKGSFRHSNTEGLFIKGLVRVVEPPRIGYEEFLYRYKIKGYICCNWVTRSQRVLKNLDPNCTLFNDNYCININKKYINGSTTRALKRKKLILLFHKVV